MYDKVKLDSVTVFYPVFRTALGSIGAGYGYRTKQEAVVFLIDRDSKLEKADRQQWIKVEHTTYDEIYN